jgi:DNA (cytosine-5)-methyltransferase 1
VDRLTISFGKWRTEALKAYGNAIVPQVMYEIFRAIQQGGGSQDTGGGLEP